MWCIRLRSRACVGFRSEACRARRWANHEDQYDAIPTAHEAQGADTAFQRPLKVIPTPSMSPLDRRHTGHAFRAPIGGGSRVVYGARIAGERVDKVVQRLGEVVADSGEERHRWSVALR